MSIKNNRYELSDVIDAAIYASLIQVNVALPGKIKSYNKSKQVADVIIGIDRLINGKKVSYPILSNIPVVFPRSSSSGVTFELVAGDEVQIVFNQRNLNNWKENGDGLSPADARLFSISDAVVFPGLFHKPMSPSQKSGTELRGKKIFVGDPSSTTTPIITTGIGPGAPAGKPVSVAAQALGLVEIVSALIDLVDGAYYGIASTGGPSDVGGGGGIDASSSTALQNLKTDLEKLKV